MNIFLESAIREVQGAQLPGLEALKFQPDSKVGKRVEELILSLEEGEIHPPTFRIELSRLIEKELGFKIVVSDNPYGPAISVPIIDTRSLTNLMQSSTEQKHPLTPIMKYLFKSEVKKAQRSIKGGEEGAVLSNGGVSGIYTEISMDMYIPMDLYSKKNPKFTPAHKTAPILHEIGHAYYYFVMLSSFSSQSYILGEITQKFFSVDSDVERHALIKRAQDVGLVIGDKVKDVKSEGELVVILLEHEFKKWESILGVSPYDSRGYEALADRYAVKMGYGRELVEALSFLYETHGIASQSTGKWVLFNIIMLVLLMITISTGTPVITVLFTTITTILYGPKLETYDTIKKRNEVVLHGIREDLKELGPDQMELKKEMIDSIDAIESIIEKTKVTMSPDLASYVYKLLSSVGSKGLKNTKIQQHLERLSRNSMTEAATRLEIGA